MMHHEVCLTCGLPNEYYDATLPVDQADDADVTKQLKVLTQRSEVDRTTEATSARSKAERTI